MHKIKKGYDNYLCNSLRSGPGFSRSGGDLDPDKTKSKDVDLEKWKIRSGSGQAKIELCGSGKMTRIRNPETLHYQIGVKTLQIFYFITYILRDVVFVLLIFFNLLHPDSARVSDPKTYSEKAIFDI